MDNIPSNTLYPLYAGLVLAIIMLGVLEHAISKRLHNQQKYPLHNLLFVVFLVVGLLAFVIGSVLQFDGQIELLLSGYQGVTQNFFITLQQVGLFVALLASGCLRIVYKLSESSGGLRRLS